jgi:hypothetical protein
MMEQKPDNPPKLDDPKKITPLIIHQGIGLQPFGKPQSFLKYQSQPCRIGGLDRISSSIKN